MAAPTDWSSLMTDLINRIADYFSHNFSRHLSSPKPHSTTADWTLLLPELINRIAGCFLANGDLDYYMDFRAVCTAWRSATDDPKSATDPRFRPRRWILLHEAFESDARLLVNTATGRILRKDLPLLRDYRHVATAVDGLLVLADKDAPHLVHVLNPFTGDMTHFAAPLPPSLVGAALVVGSSPTLVLLLDSSHVLYRADPTSKCFVLYEGSVSYPLLRLAAMFGMNIGSGQELVAAPRAVATSMFNKIVDLLRSFAIDPCEMFASNHCFLMEHSAGKLFLVVKVHLHMEVFMVDMERIAIEPVKSIGNCAIFLGPNRCFCINADKFVTVEANCIYYYHTEAGPDSPNEGIYMYDLKNEKLERITRHMMDESPPFTIIQLLCIYTFNMPGIELEWERAPPDICVIL